MLTGLPGEHFFSALLAYTGTGSGRSSSRYPYFGRIAWINEALRWETSGALKTVSAWSTVSFVFGPLLQECSVLQCVSVGSFVILFFFVRLTGCGFLCRRAVACALRWYCVVRRIRCRGCWSWEFVFSLSRNPCFYFQGRRSGSAEDRIPAGGEGGAVDRCRLMW